MAKGIIINLYFLSLSVVLFIISDSTQMLRGGGEDYKSLIGILDTRDFFLKRLYCVIVDSRAI